MTTGYAIQSRPKGCVKSLEKSKPFNKWMIQCILLFHTHIFLWKCLLSSLSCQADCSLKYNWLRENCIFFMIYFANIILFTHYCLHFLSTPKLHTAHCILHKSTTLPYENCSYYTLKKFKGGDLVLFFQLHLKMLLWAQTCQQPLWSVLAWWWVSSALLKPATLQWIALHCMKMAVWFLTK